MKRINYMYYQILVFIISFISFLVYKTLGDNIYLVILLEVLLVFMFMDNSFFINFYEYKKIKESFYDKINQKQGISIFFLIKRTLLINFLMFLLAYNFQTVILGFLIIDFIVKATLGISLIEYYLNRQIEFKNLKKEDNIDEN